MAPVVVHVEYCGAWGYGGKYERLKKAITAAVPDAKVTGVIGRKTSFEITLNGNLIYSKLKTDKFPEDAEIVAIVKKEAEATK